MSLAGGSYLGLSDSEEAADPGSKKDLPCVAMPNILDQCYVQKNQNRSPQRWPNAGGKTPTTNGKKDGNGVDESGNNKLPEPCNILYKKKLDFTLPQNKTIGCGLLNIGNTCYINSTLQCLLYLPPWYNYVTKEHQQECNISSVDCIVCMFHRFLKGALNYHGNPFAPREIVDKLKYFCANMVRGRQEDAHEFLVSFVDRMQMSLLKGVPKLVDPNSQYTTAVYKVFGTVIRSQVRCKACGWRSNNYEFGLNLILGIKNVRSLITAFKMYTKKELMDGVNAYSCERCRQRQPAEKHLSVHKAPNVLIIQLLRYDQNDYGNTKLTQHVEFNESLDLGQFMSETESQANHHVYHLNGVLVHTGMAIQSGHYFAYVRGMDRKWYKMNDERVHEVSFEEVTSTQAYILFYVRKVKEPQQKPPASSPALVKHKPGFNPALASNANYISHKPVYSTVNSNGNTKPKSELSGPSKLQSASTNGGLPKPSLNGSGDAATAVNTNSASCTTSFGVSSILNRGTKELSSNLREKVAFKINRSKDRWNNTNCNGSKPSTPAAESKMLPASGSVSNLPLVTAKTKKLVAYDDESSDQESDKNAEPVRDVAVPEKSGVDPVSCVVGGEVQITPTENAPTEINKTASGFALTETSKTTSGRQILDLEMFASKRVASEKPNLKRSSSDSDINARLSSVSAAPTVSRNMDRRLSIGDGPLKQSSAEPGLAKEFELRAKPLYNENNEFVAVDITSSDVNLTNKLQGPLPTSNERALAQPTDPPKTDLRIGELNCTDIPPDNGNTLPEATVKCNHPLTDIVEAPLVAPCMATDSSPLTRHSKKRRKSRKDDSSSCKRSHHGSIGSNSPDGLEFVWVEKTFESVHQDDIGENQNGVKDTAAEKPDCNREKQLKRSKTHHRDRHTKRRSRSVESQALHNGQSSSTSSRQRGERCSVESRSRSNRQDQTEEEQLRSKLPLQLPKQNCRRHRSGSSDHDRSFDQDSRSCHRSVKRKHRSRSSHRSAKRDDRRHRSRSSHRSSRRDDRRHRSRSSHRSLQRNNSKRRSRSLRRSVDRDRERHRSRSPRRKYSSNRDRRRSHSSHNRRNSDVRSSKSYDYHIHNRERCRLESGSR